MIETKNLTKRFDQNTVLEGLEFRVNKGEIFCFLGANGAGSRIFQSLIQLCLYYFSGLVLLGSPRIRQASNV